MKLAKELGCVADWKGPHGTASEIAAYCRENGRDRLPGLFWDLRIWIEGVHITRWCTEPPPRDARGVMERISSVQQGISLARDGCGLARIFAAHGFGIRRWIISTQLGLSAVRNATESEMSDLMNLDVREWSGAQDGRWIIANQLYERAGRPPKGFYAELMKLDGIQWRAVRDQWNGEPMFVPGDLVPIEESRVAIRAISNACTVLRHARLARRLEAVLQNATVAEIARIEALMTEMEGRQAGALESA
jgi:hypothetical protein